MSTRRNSWPLLCASLLITPALCIPASAAKPTKTSSTSTTVKPTSTSTTARPTSTTTSANCGCYTATGPSGGQYSNYAFLDFRNIDNSKGQYNAEPALVTDAQSKGKEATQAGFLQSSTFTKMFGISTWAQKQSADAPQRMQNSAQNVYIQADNNIYENMTTHLTLRTTRLQSFTSVAEIESASQNYLYGSMRFRARVRGATGAVAGLFTYYDDNNEIDIEILTRDNNTNVRCTNQPSVNSKGNVVKAAETDIDIPRDIWSHWVTYRIDWSPNQTSWYINGVNLVNKTYSVPQTPSSVILNMWSNGGEWSGPMAVGTSAYLDVAYIEMAYGTSGPASGNSKRRVKRAAADPLTSALNKRAATCSSVCSIDSQPGFPKLIS